MHRLSIVRSRGLLRARFVGLALAVAIVALPAHADIVIPAGGGLSLADGGLDAGCTDLIVGGTLQAGSTVVANVRNVDIAIGGVLAAQSSTLAVAGDWSNAGTFDPGSGHVTFADGCGVAAATVSGQSTFNDVSWLTSTGKTWQFAAGSTQNVAGSLVIAGTGAPLRFRSTVPGVDAFILPQGSLSRSNLDNADVLFGPPGADATAVPGLSAVATAFLALLLLLTVIHGARPSLAGPRSSNDRDLS